MLKTRLSPTPTDGQVESVLKSTYRPVRWQIAPESRILNGRVLDLSTRGHRMNLAGAPIAHEGIFATPLVHREGSGKIEGLLCPHCWRKSDQSRKSRYIKLANRWIMLNSGGGPTPGKPQVLLEPPSNSNRVNSFLNLRAVDVWACNKQWTDKGALFLTEPTQQSRLGMALLHA